MGLKLPPDQLALYQAIDEILWFDWDPIGVSRCDDAPRDEYQSYLPQVFQLALEAALVTEIAEYLRLVTVERIGLPASLETELPVAEKIRALKLRLIPEQMVNVIVNACRAILARWGLFGTYPADIASILPFSRSAEANHIRAKRVSSKPLARRTLRVTHDRVLPGSQQLRFRR